MRFHYALIAACALALALPSAASASFSVAISENQPSMFRDPLFVGSGFEQARVIVGYDVALDPTSAEFGRIAYYLAEAKLAGIEPLVSFQHARGDTTQCGLKKNFTRGLCRLPSQKAYETAMKAFFAAFPKVK